MDKQPSREALMQRVASLEARLQSYRKQKPADNCIEAFGLADMMQAADGICVCHAIEAFPFVRFTFWNRQMVRLTGYDMETINRQGWYQSVYPDPDVQTRAIARMAQMREGVNLEAESWEITGADGKTRILRISTSVLDRWDGTPRVMAIMHDVTEMKRLEAELRSDKQNLKREVVRQSELLADAQQALQISDTRYRALFDIAGDALFVENDRDEILDVNQRACDLLGYSRSELLSMNVCDIQAPECRDQSGCVLANELAEHRGKPFETVDLHKDGTRIPVEVTNTRLEKAGLFLSIVRDIRERKLADEARRETFEIIEKSPVAVFLWRNETDWPVEFVTRNVNRIFGYSGADFLAGRVAYSQVVHPDDLDRVAGEVRANSLAPERMEFTHQPYRIVAKDGEIHWVKDSTTIRRDAAGNITHYQGIVEAITDRVKAELAVKESEDKFSRAFHLNPDPVTITRLKDGVILDVNDSFVDVSGYSREEVLACSSVEDINLWVDPHERDRYVAALLEQGTVRDMECRFRLKNGDVRLGSICGQALEIGGEPCILGTMRDITDAREAADRLAEEKERLAVTLRSIGDAVITTDRSGRIALMNPIAEVLTGWHESDAMGLPLLDVFRIVNEKTRRPCENPVDKVISSGQIVGLANHTILIAKDGREFFIADSGAPIQNARQEIIGVVLVFRDVTVQQRMETELLKMEKLKSLGVLAGGIAHDFNNFLTGIIGNLSLAKLDLQPGNPMARPMDEMEKAALRAKELTQQLLTFSKGGEPVKHTLRLETLIRESAQFVLHGSNVRCDFDFDADLPYTDVDEGQIAQVLHNLMINADQAMPEGGTIVVRAVNIHLASDNPYALEPGNYIRLIIQDQGAGIQPAHLKRVFDPYFTTKQAGSGLGLAVAYSIIAKHDGRLSVDSTLGEGTTFTILLPASQSIQASHEADNPALLPGAGSVLVMDDEDFVRDLAAMMLEKMGYEVALAKDGQATVDMYDHAIGAGRPFDAVILDLTIPGGMGGQETLRRLMDLDPDVKAVVSSGYSNNPVMANYAAYGFKGAVKKPYLVQEMSRVLHDVINGQ
jgi:PAS domain S-box-containing protein